MELDEEDYLLLAYQNVLRIKHKNELEKIMNLDDITEFKRYLQTEI